MDLSSEITELGEERFIVAVKNTSGKWFYFRGLTVSDGLTDCPGKAAHFPLNHDRAQLLEWIEDQVNRARKLKTETILTDTVTIVLYRTTMEAVNIDSHEWKVELRRRAVSKLTNMEIKALGVEAVEMERRLAQPPGK